jgi:hypothetical protein
VNAVVTCRSKFVNDFKAIPEDGNNPLPTMKTKLGSLENIAILAVLLGTASQLGAAPGGILLNAPDFIIPIGGQSGTLDLYSDGRAPETSGFNVLGHQRLTLQGNTVSSGMLTLNLHFSGFDLDEHEFSVSAAALRLTVNDIDFLGERIGSGGMMRETAVLSSINGVPLMEAVSLQNYLPSGTTRTGRRLLTLDTVPLAGSELPASFAGPLVLSFTLTASFTTGPHSVTVNNSPERIASDVSLAVVPATIPEPSTGALLGVGALWLTFAIRRRR